MRAYPYLRPAGRGVTIDALEGLLLLREAADGVLAVPVEAAVGVDADALLFATSVSKPAQEDIPSLLPSWLTAKDSQWSARSPADRENRWHRETPAPPVCVEGTRGWWAGVYRKNGGNIPIEQQQMP